MLTEEEYNDLTNLESIGVFKKNRYVKNRYIKEYDIHRNEDNSVSSKLELTEKGEKLVQEYINVN